MMNPPSVTLPQGVYAASLLAEWADVFDSAQLAALFIDDSPTVAAILRDRVSRATSVLEADITTEPLAAVLTQIATPLT